MQIPVDSNGIRTLTAERAGLYTLNTSGKYVNEDLAINIPEGSARIDIDKITNFSVSELSSGGNETITISARALKNADLTVTPGWVAEGSSTPVVAAFNQTLAVQNFLPENIKKGIDILGVQGTLDYIKTVTSIPTTQDTSIIYNSTDSKYYLWRA